MRTHSVLVVALAFVLGFSACSGAARHRSVASVEPTFTASAASQSEDEVGSTRNARIAAPKPANGSTLTYFAGELSDAERAELASLAPGVKIVTGLSREQALERASEAHGIDARFATREFLAKAPQLVWVQAMSAGVDRYLSPALVESESLVLTNMRGVHGPAIADHAFGMLLALTRDLSFFREQQAARRWAREGSGARPIALKGRTLLVVGLGGIGSEVAQRGHGFGMRVIATRRSDAEAPDFVEHVGKPEELLALLPRADVVAICVPLTKETERLFDARAFAAMKAGSYLVNVARGKCVDTDALMAALREKKLAGACLDVTEPEPLPADHPLWTLPNVLITPHVSSDAELTDERSWKLLRENVRRFGAGEPLLNVVDKRVGY